MLETQVRCILLEYLSNSTIKLFPDGHSLGFIHLLVVLERLCMGLDIILLVQETVWPLFAVKAKRRYCHFPTHLDQEFLGGLLFIRHLSSPSTPPWWKNTSTRVKS